MASAYVDEIQKVQKSGPYYLGGHCFGGIVALDIAKKLEARREEVAVLALLEALPPMSGTAEDREVTTEQEPPPPEAVAKTAAALHLRFEQSRQQLTHLPPEHAERLWHFSREQLQMAFCYRATPIGASIVLLRTATYPDTIFETWRHLSAHSFSERIVPGNAFSMLRPPDVAVLGAQLDNVLGASQKGRH